MSKKLGEILLEGGRLTEPQLQKALKAQLIFGGHLGTSLIELGYLDEETLGETLSRAFNVPFASFDILQAVPYSVIRCIPAKLVEKYKVVPIRLDGKTLQLAMMDPKNLMALDEISFVTGYKIDPWVAPEIRIFQVLEKYYNIPRSQRYITLAREMGRRRSKGDAGAAGSKAEPSHEGWDGPAEAEDETAPVRAQAPAAAAPPPTAAPEARPVVDHGEKYGYGRSWREFAEAMERKASTPTAGSATPPEAREPQTAPRRTAGPRGTAEEELAEASRKLASCGSPEEVAEAVLAYAGRFLKRSAFFIMRGDHAIGWDGSGDGIPPGRIKGMNVALVRDSLFSLIEDGRKHYVGAVPPLPSIRRFYQDLEIPMPKATLLVPITIKEKTASVLYGDGAGDDDLRGIDLQAFERLSKKASLALQMIILRNKILSG